MTHFCTKCGNNWAKLHSIDDEVNNEIYEFCPVCHTDSFLTDAIEGPLYFMTVTGQIIDTATGKELTKEVETVQQEEREPYHLIMQRREREMERKENEALEAYHRKFESNLTEAKQAYKQIMSK